MKSENQTVRVDWNENMSLGIELIDSQHKHLVYMTNQLFNACRYVNERETVFKDVMNELVAYIKMHFTAEQELMQRINYPQYLEHKTEHDSFVKKVLASNQAYGQGEKFVPNDFVQFLKEWILSHIAHSDKMIAIFITGQKKKGQLSDKDIEG